jgi:hypothetical protein
MNRAMVEVFDTPEAINERTGWAIDRAKVRLEETDAYRDDTDKSRRLQMSECKRCYYLVCGLAGQAFTPYTCKRCGVKSSWPNTNIPKLCSSCSDGLKLCRRCGADINLRKRNAK